MSRWTSFPCATVSDGFVRRIGAVAGAALVAGCGLLAGPPTLVRDGEGIFSPEARVDAEERLRALADEHGVLYYVITAADADPPRVLDGPMAEAEAIGRPAIAIIISDGRVVGSGTSDGTDDRFIELAGAGNGTDALLADGKEDEALDLLIRTFSAGVRRP
jgi:hypothetical protein